jgi:hypothetical protein
MVGWPFGALRQSPPYRKIVLYVVQGWEPGEQVGAARLDFPWIAHPLQAHLNPDACPLHRLGDVGRGEEAEVHVHLVAQPLV